MEAIRKLDLRDASLLSAVIALLTVGFGALAWEWQTAHTPAPKHGTGAALHHTSQSNMSETTT